MKERLGLLVIIQDLIQDVQKLVKTVEEVSAVNAEAPEAINSRMVVGTVNITEAQRVAKELGKGISKCPFCNEEVRQIRAHLKACKSITPLEVDKIFDLSEQTQEKKEVVLDNDKVRPEDIVVPAMKLRCNMCKHTMETDQEEHFAAFWETGLFCEKCTDGRMVSNMTVEEVDAHKKYRVMKPTIRQGKVTV